MRSFKQNIYRLSTEQAFICDLPGGTAIPSPYSLTTSCFPGNISNSYTLGGVPVGATVVVKATFSGYLVRSGTYQANATLTVDGNSQTSQPCISAQGSFYLQVTDTFAAASNGVFNVSAVATNYSSAVGVNLYVELVSVNGVPVGSQIVGCWGQSGGANGCPI